MILVYQAYGHRDVLEQTLFSVLTLFEKLKSESPLHVWIYTDQEAYFRNFFGNHSRLRYFPITPETLILWRGKINFVHRVKVEMLWDASKQFDGNIFYCDGDTFFKEDPTYRFNQVNNSLSLMHVAECQLDQGRDPLTKKIHKFVKRNTFLIDGKTFNIPPDSVMWNAGVLGFSQDHKSLLPQVLSLTDQMHTLYPKHVMEQLAFSVILQSSSRVAHCEDIIGHYWNQKPAYQEAIRNFINEYPQFDKALVGLKNFSHPQGVSLGMPVQKGFLNKISSWFKSDRV